MADRDASDLAPLTPRGRVAGHVACGAIIDRWQCPGCGQTIDIVHRSGRPRIYCSHACRQRIYRQRRQRRIHTTATPAWPAEAAYAESHEPRTHALRSRADPLAHRHDRRHRELTVCGLLARTRRRPGITTPFLPGGLACRTCSALTRPRPRGHVSPHATAAHHDPHTDSPEAIIEQLRAIHPNFPLHPQLRHLLTTTWSPGPPRRCPTTHRQTPPRHRPP